MKNRKIKSPIANTSRQIGIFSSNNVLNYNDFAPAFSFEYVQSNYCLSKCNQQEIRRLISKLVKLEQHTWAEIFKLRLYDIKPTSRAGIVPDIPSCITPDATIYYFKPFGSSNSFRVFGVRDKHNFKFIWFDRNHEVYPG